jgi:hypothetical protein
MESALKRGTQSPFLFSIAPRRSILKTTSKRRRLTVDVKAVKLACWLLPANVDLANLRPRRTMPTPGDEFVNLSSWSLGDRCHRAVGAVHNPSRQAKVLRFRNRRGAEIDSLHSAVDLEMNADVI